MLMARCTKYNISKPGSPNKSFTFCSKSTVGLYPLIMELRISTELFAHAVAVASALISTQYTLSMCWYAQATTKLVLRLKGQFNLEKYIA